MAGAEQPAPPVAKRRGIPRWAWLAAGALVLGVLAVLYWGRGGTAMLGALALALAALAVLLLAEPDGDPAAEQ